MILELLQFKKSQSHMECKGYKQYKKAKLQESQVTLVDSNKLKTVQPSL